MKIELICIGEVLGDIKEQLNNFSGKDLAILATKITGKKYTYCGDSFFEVEYE